MEQQNIKNESEEMDKKIVSSLVEESLMIKYSEILKNEYGITKTEHKIKKLKPIYTIAASICAVLIAVIVMQYNVSDDSKSFAQQLALETTMLGDHSTSRKDLAMVDQLRINANNHFISEKYDSASYYYSLIIQSNQQTDSDYLYAAVALLKNKNYDATKALTYLNKIHDNNIYQQEVRWFRALALVLTDKTTEATTLLNQIIANHDEKEKEAIQLLEKIKP